MDTEQATNRLLFALSQHPGMTTNLGQQAG
jgi:hypothetical protein